MKRAAVPRARTSTHLPSRRITRSKKTLTHKISKISDGKPGTKRPWISNAAISNGAAFERPCCIACGNSESELAKCAICGGHYHVRCVDPSGKEMPGSGWVCGICRRPEELTRAFTIPPSPRAPASQSTLKAKAHSAELVQSMLARLSGESTSDRRLYPCETKPIDERPTAQRFDYEEQGVHSSSVTDAVLVWALKCAGGGGGSENAAATKLSAQPPAMESVEESVEDAHRRRSGGMRRAISGVGDGKHALCGYVGPRCYCGNTDGTKAIARCVSCAAVFHPSCMDPPYPSLKSLPIAGYTCLACRPACGVCGVGMLPESPTSLKINCAACKLMFHRACLTPPAVGPCDEWECLKCSLASEESNDQDEALPVERREPAAPRAESKILEDLTRLKTDRQQGWNTIRTSATSHVFGKFDIKQRACVVCGVAEGRRMNVCGSCGDAYHSLCLDRPRTRRAGDIWRCDSCRSSAPTDARTPSVVPPSLPRFSSPPPSRGVTPARHTDLAATSACAPGGGNTGHWTQDEHTRFLKVREGDDASNCLTSASRD